MKEIKIDLAESFEDVVEKMRSLPATGNFSHGKKTAAPELSSEVAEVLRCLYEAARGQQVATQIGLLPIAPPVAPFLKDEPFYVQSQADFLLQALARLYSGSCSRSGVRSREPGRTISSRKRFRKIDHAVTDRTDSTHINTKERNYEQPAYSHHHSSS